MLLAFCILSHGKPLLTSRCVDNLCRHGASDIIILDNGSGDEDFALLSELVNGKAVVKRSESNLGITRGRIALADTADGLGAHRIVFLDNDQFPSKQAMSAYESKPRGHLLGAEAWAVNQDFRPVSMVWGEGDRFTYVGCGGLCVDMSDWKAVGGFDPQFSPYYFEDPDFCLRAFDIGFSMHPVKKDFVIHEAHSTLSGKKDRMAMFLSNYVKFRNKWLGRRDLLQRGVISWD